MALTIKQINTKHDKQKGSNLLKYKPNKRTLFLRIAISIVIMLSTSSCSKSPAAEIRKQEWSKPVVQSSVHNLYKVDNKLYRSAQPDSNGFKELYELGIRNDLNLRQYHGDAKYLKEVDIVEYRIPIRTSNKSYEELVEAVRFIVNAKEPVLVHCRHGSDRTGTTVAGYRIAVQNWDKENAIDEMMYGGYGHHEIFNNLRNLLRSLHVKQFKKDIYGDNYKH